MQGFFLIVCGCSAAPPDAEEYIVVPADQVKDLEDGDIILMEETNND